MKRYAAAGLGLLLLVQASAALASTQPPPASLELRIAAQPGVDPSDSQAMVERFQQSGPYTATGNGWRWFKIADIASFVDDPQALPTFTTSKDAFTDCCRQARGLVGVRLNQDYYLLLADTPDKAMADDGTWGLDHASRSVDHLGRPAIAITFDPAGAGQVTQLTSPHIGRGLAIVIDQQVIAAPVIQAQLGTGAVITGRFSQAKADDLARRLNARAFAAPTVSTSPVPSAPSGQFSAHTSLAPGWLILMVGGCGGVLLLGAAVVLVILLTMRKPVS